MLMLKTSKFKRETSNCLAQYSSFLNINSTEKRYIGVRVALYAKDFTEFHKTAKHKKNELHHRISVDDNIRPEKQI